MVIQCQSALVLVPNFYQAIVITARKYICKIFWPVYIFTFSSGSRTAALDEQYVFKYFSGQRVVLISLSGVGQVLTVKPIVVMFRERTEYLTSVSC